MKLNRTLVALLALSTVALSACNGGGGGSAGQTLSQFVLTCNPGAGENIPYGESYTLTATLPVLSTATIVIGATQPGFSQQSAQSCDITNGTSCNITVENINTSGSTVGGGGAIADTSGYTVASCSTPNLLSQ